MYIYESNYLQLIFSLPLFFTSIFPSNSSFSPPLTPLASFPHKLLFQLPHTLSLFTLSFLSVFSLTRCLSRTLSYLEASPLPIYRLAGCSPAPSHRHLFLEPIGQPVTDQLISVVLYISSLMFYSYFCILELSAHLCFIASTWHCTCIYLWFQCCVATFTLFLTLTSIFSCKFISLWLKSTFYNLLIWLTTLVSFLRSLTASSKGPNKYCNVGKRENALFKNFIYEKAYTMFNRNCFQVVSVACGTEQCK